MIASWGISTGDLIFDGICEIETNEWTSERTDVYAAFRVYYFAGGWSGEVRGPSWWPIASLASLVCTHRWTRLTQRTNVARRVLLRKEVVDFPPSPSDPPSNPLFHPPPSLSHRGRTISPFSLFPPRYLCSTPSLRHRKSIIFLRFFFPLRLSVFLRLIVLRCLACDCRSLCDVFVLSSTFLLFFPLFFSIFVACFWCVLYERDWRFRAMSFLGEGDFS